MAFAAKSIRPFIGAKDFETSRKFYREIGFEETVISKDMSVFNLGGICFYLQDYFVEDWINNTMIFLEVADLDFFYQELQSLNLASSYQNVKLKPIQNLEWGRECFLHDPSGVLWHIGSFRK